MVSKRCKCCDEVFEPDAFYVMRRTKTGAPVYDSWCKACRREAVRTRRDPARWARYMRVYRLQAKRRRFKGRL